MMHLPTDSSFLSSAWPLTISFFYHSCAINSSNPTGDYEPQFSNQGLILINTLDEWVDECILWIIQIQYDGKIYEQILEQIERRMEWFYVPYTTGEKWDIAYK